MSLILTRAIEETAQEIAENLPDEIRTLISLANSDLYGGPVYLDADGEECSCFDDGATPFSFKSACEQIAEALSDVSDVYVTEDGCVCDREPEGCFETDTDEGGEEIEVWCEPEPSYAVDASTIIRHIVGVELARYV